MLTVSVICVIVAYSDITVDSNKVNQPFLIFSYNTEKLPLFDDSYCPDLKPVTQNSTIYNTVCLTGKSAVYCCT
jgi:hypothetical protein